MSNQAIEILTLLYELSLTSLKHLSPEDTARTFIKKLLSRRSYQYGAVWLFEDFVDDQFRLSRLYSMPELPDVVNIEAQRFVDLFRRDDLVITKESLISDIDLSGKFAYFRLADIGLLEVFTQNSEDPNFTKESFYPFMDVISQFAVSLESGQSYQRLQKEVRQRKEAEVQLKASEEKYRRIIDNIQLGLLEVDTREEIQHANESFLKLTGYTLEELKGKVASKFLLDPSYQEIMDVQNENRKEGRSTSYEAALRDKFGNRKWFIVSGAPNYNSKGELIGSIGIHLDISEEKKLKEENIFKDTQLKKIYEMSLDGLISADEEGKIIEWSPQAATIFGIDAKDVIGKKLVDTIIPHRYREQHESGMHKFLQTGEAFVLNNRIEISALRKDGTEFPIELTVFPLKFNNKHYFTAFVRDISEIIASRESMEKAFQHQIELNDMKSQFISMTSHELRTPLTTIRNNTEIINYLLDNPESMTMDKLKKNVSRIENNVDRLNQLINNILTMGQLDSKKVPFNPEPVKICDFVKTRILPDYISRGQSIICAKKGEEESVMLDQKLFTHIITNLIENALKYTPEHRPAPELRMEFHPDHTLVQVSDHGMGIPEKDQSRLFETFFRASNVGNIQGTGLGLSIVRQFVKIHGGEIKVKSKVDEGTTFSIFFPKFRKTT